MGRAVHDAEVLGACWVLSFVNTRTLSGHWAGVLTFSKTVGWRVPLCVLWGWACGRLGDRL